MANEESFATLKRKRASVQGACTRMKTYVDSVRTVTQSVIAQLEERKVKLERYWTDYDEVQSSLEAVDESEGNHRVIFEEAFFSMSAKMRELTISTLPSTSRDLDSPSPSSADADAAGVTRHMRLPKLSLPTFSGKYDEWFPFFDSFQAIIHTNPSLSNIQRFQYLKASLSGDASKVVSALEISSLNYTVAWDLLKERYDNKRVIVQGHIRAIMDLPAMSKENAIDLRQIADGMTRHIQALQALKRPTEHWDDLLVHIVSNKLDGHTLREWQISLTTPELPTLKQFTDFITHRCQVLEATSKTNGTLSKGASPRSQSGGKRNVACAASVKTKCTFCRGEHSVYYCKEFLALAVAQRITEIRKRKICINCLRTTAHSSSKCPSGSCKICGANHNTLLHAHNQSSSPRDDKERGSPKESNELSKNEPTVVTQATTSCNDTSTLLSTAVVYACDAEGSQKSCRLLLDCGSQANFVTKKFLAVLGIKARSSKISISGIGQTATWASQMAQIRLRSRINSFTAIIDCIVTDNITGKIPTHSLKHNGFEIPRNLKLADPRFNISSDVDVLVGAELFWRLICIGQIRATQAHPTLQKTIFGWILAGRLLHSPHVSGIQALHVSVHNEQLHDQLSRFWQIEEASGAGVSRHYTREENFCEQHFVDNVSRDSQGRFVVKLPFKEQARSKIGESKHIALKRLQGLERRFKHDLQLKKQYSDFLREYAMLNHMKRVENPNEREEESIYLPHHCVFKSGSRSSKIRVVFDASSKSSTGVSLNDALRTGPTVQQELINILIRFRMFNYALVADIKKMYRQIRVHHSQTNCQRILWREDPASEIEIFELQTVTYGTSPASYLATRCLKELADIYKSRYPIGAVCVNRDFYVDDLLTGANTLNEAMKARDETVDLLKLGGFELDKWASNCPELLETRSGESVTINSGFDSCVLGIHWNQATDAFYFRFEAGEARDTISKRMILSEISRLFDPLGLLGPVIVLAKLILQELWQAGAHWDESIPADISSKWTRLKSQLQNINQLKISRCVRCKNKAREIQLHGFCDASQRAYGTCIYIRTKIKEGEYQSELLCSKSRVAPLKAISLPRLELSAALLLSRLIAQIKEAIDSAQIHTHLWSDSTIALNWIASPSRKWSTFVANRVGEIQRLTESYNWRHIASGNNPADILSRGLEPHEIINARTWWHGPDFLAKDESSWPKSDFVRSQDEIPEARKITTVIAITGNSIVEELLMKCSDLDKACRILSYCFRVSKRRKSNIGTRFVSHLEISVGLEFICRSVQESSFPKEYGALNKGKTIDSASNLLALSPFLDSKGLIRVGGRLRNAKLSFEVRHPILLPRSHVLTKRIIEREHIRTIHAGTQATMAAVRQRFWPLSLKTVTRSIVRNCVTCFKAKPTISETVMGSLPAGRVTVSRPFHHCGVDYAGPLLLRESKRRNAKNTKAYVAIFVCFATKAAHIEVVSDLTSAAFIGALKRFVSRRGKPSHMYSDNGTTFVGAKGQLKEFFDYFNTDNVQIEIREFLCKQETTWSFIPPNAPHFGGLWEAAVKSAKYHLQRIVGRAHLSFEEMSTVLSEIEAILNSRPLTPLSEDSNDFAYLSPGHFLIGTPLNSFPYHNLTDINENKLIRWQRVEQIRQHFWSRWSTEYLHSLQERCKWRICKGQQLKVNQLVLLKQQSVPPLQWLLGRVEQLHMGTDGYARAATVRTATGSFVRPLAKIAILPVDT